MAWPLLSSAGSRARRPGRRLRHTEGLDGSEPSRTTLSPPVPGVAGSISSNAAHEAGHSTPAPSRGSRPTRRGRARQKLVTPHAKLFLATIPDHLWVRDHLAKSSCVASVFVPRRRSLLIEAREAHDPGPSSGSFREGLQRFVPLRARSWKRRRPHPGNRDVGGTPAPLPAGHFSDLAIGAACVNAVHGGHVGVGELAPQPAAASLLRLRSPTRPRRKQRRAPRHEEHRHGTSTERPRIQRRRYPRRQHVFERHLPRDCQPVGPNWRPAERAFHRSRTTTLARTSSRRSTTFAPTAPRRGRRPERRSRQGSSRYGRPPQGCLAEGSHGRHAHEATPWHAGTSPARPARSRPRRVISPKPSQRGLHAGRG